MEQPSENPDISQSKEVKFAKHPEIIANPPNPDTKLIVSIPTYHREWERGALQRSVEAMLSQNSNMEANYIMNTGSKHPWKEAGYDSEGERLRIDNPDVEAQDAFGKAQEGISFLRDVVNIQRIAKEGNNAQIEEIIEKYNDPHTQEVLRLAAKKADRVAISAIDATKTDLNELGYTDTIDGFRTLGADYAVNRFERKTETIYLMSDTDTVPAFNSMGSELVEVFDKNPQAKYFFVRLGYQAPGEEKVVVETSTQFIGDKVAGYNMQENTGAPQIAIRLDALEDIEEITRMFGAGTQGDEDRDTSERLIGKFGDVSEGLLIDYPNMAIPLQLTQDRTMGFNDGKHRLSNAENNRNRTFEEQIEEVQKRGQELMDTIQQEIKSIDDDALKQHLEQEANNAYVDLEKKQKALNRFNRQVVGDFLNIRENIPKDPSVELSNETKMAILQEPRGKALLGYLENNRALIAQLSDEDIEVMNFFLGRREDMPVSELSTFQKTIREYIGEYPDEETETSEKTMVMQPLLTEYMALGHVHALYTQRKVLLEGTVTGSVSGQPDTWVDMVRNYQPRFADRDKSWAYNQNPKPQEAKRINPVLNWAMSKLSRFSKK